MTDRHNLDDWLTRSAHLIGPACDQCGRPASFESWHPDRPGIIRPLCQNHAAQAAAERLSGNTDAPIVQLSGT